MMLQLELSPEMDERLRQEAELRKLPVETIVLNLLNERLPPVWNEARNAAAVAMLQQWIKEDEKLEEEDDDELFRLMDEDRLSDRPLFPPEKKGITW